MQDAVAVLDRGSDRDELGHVRAPLVAADVEPDAHHAVRSELVGFLFHPRHRQSRALYIAWESTSISWLWLKRDC